MVHPKDRQDGLFRLEHDEEPFRQPGRLPHAGEVVGRKAPPYRVTGLDALAPLLLKVPFPTTTADLVDLIGDAVIPIDQHRTTRVSTLIERTQLRSFSSRDDLERAISRIFHERGAREEANGRGGRHHQRDDTTR